MKSSVFIPVLLLILSSFVACAAADELESALYGSGYLLAPGKLGSLPPYIEGAVAFQEAAIQPAESRLRVNLAERTLTIKTSYLDRKLITDPSTGEERQRSIFSLYGSSDLAGEEVKSEGEFAFNNVESKVSDNTGETPKKFRLALKGSWQDYSYGAEYRSVDKGFIDVRGAEVNRNQGLSQIWGETSLGPVRVKTTLAQVSESGNEYSDAPRLSRASSLSLDYRTAGWETVLSSSYSLRSDRFNNGSSADVISHELRTSYKLFPEIQVIPVLRFTEERDKSSGIRSEMPATGWTITYNAWRNIVNFVGSTSINWAQSSDRLTNSKDVNSTGKIIWKLDESSEIRRTFSYEVSYTNHLDLSESCHSTTGFSTKMLLTIYRF